jgi:serine/threonine protein kinase
MTSASTTPLVAGYRIEELAARGGMGVVYRATQLALGRPVALKLISPEFADDPQFRERFQRESRLAASVDHPNVIPVYEAGETDGCLFISMRWVEGTDLNTMIKRGGGLDPERAAGIVSQIGAALDAAHGRGLLHRDVKPANVLVTAGAGEHVYLTDFGLVKRMGGNARLTRSGELLGTVDYIAPEQIRGRAADRRSDVYSLGCVLFHCLTGAVPFEADDDVAKIYAHLNEPPPRPTEIVPWLPPELDEVVARAMAKDPADRYRSAGELGAAALAAARPSAPERPTVATGRSSPARTRRRAAAVALVALAIPAALLLGGAFEAGDDPSPGPRPSSPLLDDGILVRERESGRVYVLKAGAKFPITAAQRAAFGYDPARARTLSRRALDAIPDVPRDGSYIRTNHGTTVWEVRGGTRYLADKPPGADVAVIPRSALLRIPPPAGGRRTSTTMTAPATIYERRKFLLIADIRSDAGVPEGACVFYRVTLRGLKERANLRTDDGRCEARLRVGGLRSVRYSVHFVGSRGWRGSKAATAPIPVTADP